MAAIWSVVRPRYLTALVTTAAMAFALAACAPAAAPQAPAAQPAKPAAEPAKPAVEPAKPTAEPAKPAVEPAKPAAQPAKPAAPAKAYKIVMGHSLNPGEPSVDTMSDFKKEVEEKSGGRIEVQVFHSGQLGSQEQVLEMVKSGAAQIQVASPQYPAKYLPELQAVTLPFLFADSAAFDKLLDGPLGTELSGLVEQKTDFKVLSYEEFGLKHVFNRRRPINTLEDLKGMKLRVIDSPVPIKTFQALGASPVGMPGTEMYSATQTGVIDGAEQPLNVIRANKFYEVAKYLSLTGHFYEIAMAYANKASINDLPPDLRKIVMDAAQNMAKKERQVARANAATARDFLTQQGMVVNDVAPAEIAKMQAAVRPVYDFAKQQWGDAFVTKVLQAAGR